MKPEIKQRLVEALRSGCFQQSVGDLRHQDDECGDCFCAMGVLCELYREDHPEAYWKQNFELHGVTAFFASPADESSEESFYGNVYGAPKKVLEWAGVDSTFEETVVEWNDSEYRTFEEIAQLIDEAY